MIAKRAGVIAGNIEMLLLFDQDSDRLAYFSPARTAKPCLQSHIKFHG